MSETIEWLEWGWPLVADGSCDRRAATEVGPFARSSGLASLSTDELGRWFDGYGGHWNPARGGSWSPPAAFPAALVLRACPSLQRNVGRGLVLALVERRRENASGRDFWRSIWFLLPAGWTGRPDPRRIGAAASRLLGWAAGPGVGLPVEVDTWDEPLPRLDPVASTARFTVRDPANPVATLAALLSEVNLRCFDPTELPVLLADGVAVGGPTAEDAGFHARVASADLRLPADWQPGIPYLAARAAAEPVLVTQNARPAGIPDVVASEVAATSGGRHEDAPSVVVAPAGVAPPASAVRSRVHPVSQRVGPDVLAVMGVLQLAALCVLLALHLVPGPRRGRVLPATAQTFYSGTGAAAAAARDLDRGGVAAVVIVSGETCADARRIADVLGWSDLERRGALLVARADASSFPDGIFVVPIEALDRWRPAATARCEDGAGGLPPSP